MLLLNRLSIDILEVKVSKHNKVRSSWSLQLGCLSEEAKNGAVDLQG